MRTSNDQRRSTLISDSRMVCLALLVEAGTIICFAQNHGASELRVGLSFLIGACPPGFIR